MSLESFDHRKASTQEELRQLYDSLPEKMKTEYYGPEPQGQLFSKKEAAGADPLPHVMVTFANGKRISLHLTLKSDLSFEQQANQIKQASLEDPSITDVDLMWQPAIDLSSRRLGV